MRPIDLSDVTTETTQLLERVEDVGDALTTERSLLPDWTVGHVLAHIALNAEAFVLVAEARRRGELGVMYPHGSEGRNRDIAELAARPATTILARLHTSATAFEAAWTEPVPEGACTPAVGRPEFAASSVLLRRLRELAAHGVDIGHALTTPDNWADRFVDTDLPLQWDSVADRLPDGVGVTVVDDLGRSWTAGSGEIVETAMSRRDLLAWTIDRGPAGALPSLTSWG